MAANLLWAHLLRKDATTTESPSQIPLIAPQDRTGTSMRMLIHDTQANLEKFSARLDGLLQGVDDCRAQVVNANKLLDVERDKVSTEILEIAHRCQSELKAHLGTPAQAPALDLLHVSQVSAEKSVQALEKRVDALQALLQTHVHAMQSIQDQQNTLIGAVLPLVPILHGIPSQVNQIKAALSDSVANAVSTVTNSVENIRSTLIAEFAHGCGCVGSSTRVGSSSRSVVGSQRNRSNPPVVCPRETNVLVSSPSDNRGHDGLPSSLKRARVEGATHPAGNVRLPRKLSRLAVPTTLPSDPSPLSLTPRAPRQPLADLPLLSTSNTPRVQHRSVSHVNSISRGYTRLLGHADPDLQSPTVTRQRPRALEKTPLAADNPVVGFPNAAGPPDQDAVSKAIKIEDILEPNLTGIFSIDSSPLSSPPSSVPGSTRYHPNDTSANMAQPSMQQFLSLPDVPLVELVPVLLPSSDPFTSNPDVSPPKSMSLRDRRAQISRFGRTETRRFMPLAPWSDEE